MLSMCSDGLCFFFFTSRRRHTRCYRDWSSDVCSSDLRTASGRKAGRRFPHLRVRNRCRSLREWWWYGGQRRRKRSEERRVGKKGKTEWTSETRREEHATTYKRSRSQSHTEPMLQRTAA